MCPTFLLLLGVYWIILYYKFQGPNFHQKANLLNIQSDLLLDDLFLELDAKKTKWFGHRTWIWPWIQKIMHPTNPLQKTITSSGVLIFSLQQWSVWDNQNNPPSQPNSTWSQGTDPSTPKFNFPDSKACRATRPRVAPKRCWVDKGDSNSTSAWNLIRLRTLTGFVGGVSRFIL